METTTNHIQSFEQIPALKNAINNLSSEVLSPTTAPTILISVASKIYQLFAPLRTVNNFSGEKSDEILFVDKPNLLESPLQLLLREIRGHFRLAGEPTLSIPSMSLRINPALSCVTELTPLHLLVLHQQQATQEPLLLVVEDEQHAFDERWTALLQQCQVDRTSASALVDSSVDDVVSNGAALSNDQQATAEEDDEDVDLDIDSPPTSVREETTVQTTTIIHDAEIHSEVLVSTTVETTVQSHEVSIKPDEHLALETSGAVNQEPIDEELDDVDVADVSASVTNNSGDETLVGQKRPRDEQEEAIIDGEPEPKRPKLDVDTTTVVTTVTETTVDMIQVE